MENRIYVSIPLDALIVSGITSDCAVQISAVDGAILREQGVQNIKDGSFISHPTYRGFDILTSFSEYQPPLKRQKPLIKLLT